jgi:hypothetical protein
MTQSQDREHVSAHSAKATRIRMKGSSCVQSRPPAAVRCTREDKTAVLTKGPNFSGDLPESAQALRDGVGCCVYVRTPIPPIAASTYRRAPPSVHTVSLIQSFSIDRGKRTGAGLIIRAVCCRYSFGLWRMSICGVRRINSMRVGCIATALVALNMSSAGRWADAQ